jgi:hypothetical protein
VAPPPNCEGGSGRHGVAVGCLGMPYTLLREVQGELGRKKWMRSGKGKVQVTPLAEEVAGAPNMAALHLIPEAAAAFTRLAERRPPVVHSENSTPVLVPDALAARLADGSIKWFPGLRPHSPAWCAAP